MDRKFEAVNFDYGDLNKWKSYFEELKEVYKSCKIVEEFWNELKRNCDGLTFEELQEDFDYSTALLGGVTQDGEYKEGSLAKVYADLFGFKPENIHDLIEKLKKGLPPTTKIVVRESVISYIVRKETEFIIFVRRILDKVVSILGQAKSKGLIASADINVEIDYFGILSDYKKLIEILENFVNNIAKILPNYNQKSLFVWTLDKLTYRYMTTAYPELKNEKVFEVVKDILGLDLIFSPDIADESVKKDYSIYSYRSGSIGNELIELFKYVWREFTDKDYSVKKRYLSTVFPNLPNFALEFCKEAVTLLKAIGYRLPDIEMGDRKYDSYAIDGLTLKYVGELSVPKDRQSLSLIDTLDNLAPALMLLNGLLFELEIDRYYDRYSFCIIRDYVHPLHELSSNCGFYELARR